MAAQTVTTKPGDSLVSIAARAGTTPAALLAVMPATNRPSPTAALTPGQVITIPART